MSRKDGTEHIIDDVKTRDWVCLHCGERRPSPVPAGGMPLRVFLAKMQGFILLHRDCRPEKEAG